MRIFPWLPVLPYLLSIFFIHTLCCCMFSERMRRNFANFAWWVFLKGILSILWVRRAQWTLSLFSLWFTFCFLCSTYSSLTSFTLKCCDVCCTFGLVSLSSSYLVDSRWRNWCTLTTPVVYLNDQPNYLIFDWVVKWLSILFACLCYWMIMRTVVSDCCCYRIEEGECVCRVLWPIFDGLNLAKQRFRWNNVKRSNEAALF